MDYVLSIKNKLNVDLISKTLERSMKSAPTTSADGILCTLNQVFGGKSNTAGIDVVADGELEPDELATIKEGDKDAKELVELENNTVAEQDSISKLKMHDLMMVDPWVKGREQFMKKEVVQMRDSALTRRKKKSKVRDCILTAINDAYSEKKNVVAGMEMEGRPRWQRYARKRKCNLQF